MTDRSESDRIFKYPLLVEDSQVIEMPFGAELLCVQVQGNTPCLWARVFTEAPMERRKLYTYGAGHPMFDKRQRYVGTYQMRGGALVFHVYDGGRE